MPRVSTAALENAAIHIGESPPPPVAFAAEELQRYLGRIVNQQLAIRRHTVLGAHQLVLAAGCEPAEASAQLEGDAFALIPEPVRVTLHAGSARGLLHAVYALLEQLGCRWSLQQFRDEMAPRLPDGGVELRALQRQPAFAVRGYCSDIMAWHYTQPELLHAHLEEDHHLIDWMGKTGANAFFYIRHPFDTQLTIPELLPEFARRGIDLEYGGHVIPLLLPRELYRDHAQYFPAATDGERTDHGNLCSSNAEAVEVAAATAVEYAQAYPEMQVLHIWGADLWHGGWCHCAQCRGISVQDQSLRMCNAVAGALADAGVMRPVCYLAYHDTLEPNLQLRPDENVWAELAPRERCYGHALNDAGCATNRRYAAALERYVELFTGRVRLFEYYGDAILFCGCAVPLTEVIAADLDYYHRLGVPQITMLQFGAFSAWAYPLNFEAFAARTCGKPVPPGEARASNEARVAIVELERAMRRVVTYGDIRRPPRDPQDAARVLGEIEVALPVIAAVAGQLDQLDDASFAAHGVLVRYTAAMLHGVTQQLRSQHADADAQYAAALRLVETLDARVIGVWGRVDLPFIHQIYAGRHLDLNPQASDPAD
jgi:hypothetical protein